MWFTMVGRWGIMWKWASGFWGLGGCLVVRNLFDMGWGLYFSENGHKKVCLLLVIIDSSISFYTQIHITECKALMLYKTNLTHYLSIFSLFVNFEIFVLNLKQILSLNLPLYIKQNIGETLIFY